MDKYSLDPVTAKRLAERLKQMYGKIINVKEDFFGSTPPSCLVSSYNYPNVNVGVLLTEEDDPEKYDNFEYWSENEIDISKILEYRVKLINARKTLEVTVPRRNNKFYEKVVETVLSIKSIDIEAKISKVNLTNRFSRLLPFYGLYGKLKYFDPVSNAKIPNKVLYLVEDQIKAEQAVVELYKNNFTDYYITRLLSLGILGLKNNRKLVPSKWAITATHSTIIKYLERKLRDLKSLEKIFVFNKKFYGNDFYILVFPGNLKYELIEAILPGSAYNLKYNFPIIGRDDKSGGYFAGKLSFLEFLEGIKRKANAITIRIVTNEYKLPLGVWVVREGIKKAFTNDFKKFEDINSAIRYINQKLSKYNLNVYKLLKYSKIYKQKSLNNWISMQNTNKIS